MTREQLMAAMRRAHEAGDEAGARRIAGMIQALPSEGQSAPAPSPAVRPEPARPRTAEQQVIDGVYARLSEPLSEDFIGDQFSGPDPFAALHPDLQAGLDEMNAPNFVEGVSASIGRGAPFIDAAGANIRGAITGEDPERLRLNREQQAAAFADRMPRTADVAASVPSGISRGITGLGDLASFAGETIGQGVDALTGGEFDLPEFGRVTGAVEAAQGAPFSAPTTDLGGYAQTVSEFASGAAAMGARSLSALGRYGVAPGVAFEGAGQALEGSPMQVPAQIAAALATPAALSRLSTTPANFSRRSVAGGDPTRRAQADTLEAAGVRPTVGQASGSRLMRAMEGSAEASGQQLDDFTAAAMRSIGAQGGRATPDALAAAQSQIVGQMDDALKGVTIPVNASLARRADDIAAAYAQDAPAGAVVGRVRTMVDELVDMGTRPSGGTMTAENLRSWRSVLGRMTQSSDEATRNAAHSLRALIDDATDTALISAGREADIAALAASREQYRNFLAVQDAATRVGAEAGTLSPAALRSSVMRTQGRAAVATGRGTDLEGLSRAGANVLRPLPTVAAGAGRSVAGAANALTGGGAGALALATGASPTAAGLAAGVGLLAPPLARAGMRTNTAQAIMREPGRVAQRAGRVAPGIAAGMSESDATARLMSAGFTPQQAIAIIQRGPAAIEAALGE